MPASPGDEFNTVYTSVQWDRVARGPTGPSTSCGAEIRWAPLAELRRRRIAEAAYFKAEKRGFNPSLELVDWPEAE